MPEPRRRRRSSRVDWALRLAAALAAYVALWIVIPPPTYPMLVLAVGAPEISPLLSALSLAILGLVFLRRHRAVLDWITVACAAITLGLCAIPLVQLPGTIARFDSSLKTALGAGFGCSASPDVRLRQRQNPISLTQMVTGIGVTRDIAISRDVRLSPGDSQSLTLDIYAPAWPGSFPVVVQIYGGAWRHGHPSDDAQFASALAAAGYVVAAIDYRHAPRWQFPAQSADVDSALSWIRANAARYKGNPDAIALLGRSSGAELALLAAYDSDSSHFKAAISYYGPVDLTDGFLHPPRPDPLDIRPIQINYLGGTPSEVPERYRAASPVSLVRRGLPPTLLIYGARDHVVEPRFGKLLHDSLTAAGNSAVLLEIPWAEHAFDAVPGGPGSQIALYEVERFLGWAFAADRLNGGKCSN